MLREEPPYIYVAGPLFDPGERWYLEQIDAICRDLGLRTYLPTAMVASKSGAATDFAGIFAADLAALTCFDYVLLSRAARWRNSRKISGSARLEATHRGGEDEYTSAITASTVCVEVPTLAGLEQRTSDIDVGRFFSQHELTP